MREIWRRSKDRDRLMTNPHYMAWDEWWGKGNKQDFPSTLEAEKVRRATWNAHARHASACAYGRMGAALRAGRWSPPSIHGVGQTVRAARGHAAPSMVCG